MRIIFAGTPEFAAAHLTTLLDSKVHDLVAVYTQPDRRAGRGKKTLPSPVKQMAEQANVAVQQPASFKDQYALDTLAAYNADIMVVAAYGLLLPKAVLETPIHGCINVHASLLPRWRGAAPVERAIIAGDTQTGITIMQMAEGLDTGDMLLVDHCDIGDRETGDSLREKLVAVGAPLLLKALQQIDDGSVLAEVQDETQSCYASKLSKDEAQLNWSEPAVLIDRKIRAFNSVLTPYTLMDAQRIAITEACVKTEATASSATPGTIVAVNKNSLLVQCGEQALEIGKVQIPGSKAMAVSALLNGRPGFFQSGQCFSAPGNQ